jgi:Ca-activated chloride channel homolog
LEFPHILPSLHGERPSLRTFFGGLKLYRWPADKPSVLRTTLTAAVLVLLVAIAKADDGTPNFSGLVASNGVAAANGKAPLFASPESIAASVGQPWTIATSSFPGYTIHRTVSEVRLQFSVADERGRLVTSLAAGDFRVIDNQLTVQRIRQFLRLDNLPLQLGILLDVSDSVQKNIVREKLATQLFVQQVLRPQTDRAFLMAFARDVQLWQSSTGEPAELHSAVEQIHQPGGATNLYDGLFSACLNQFPQRNEGEAGQRVLVLFSDGEDTGSLHGLSETIALAQRSEVQIFALSVHPRRKPTPGDEILQRLAEETGGQLYVASSDKDFSAAFSAMEQQMRIQYSVSFQPQQDTRGFHALRLELTGPTNLRVRARQGYYFDAP